jgi:hypothetical protein
MALNGSWPVVLLYTTSDSRFALRALEALREAHIECSSNPSLGLEPRLESATDELLADDASVPSKAAAAEPYVNIYSSVLLRYAGIAIFVERERDYQRASAILLKLGAVRQSTVSSDSVALLNHWVIWFAVIAALVVIVYVWQKR